MELYFDLETIPREDPTEEEIKACSSCKKPDTIQKDFEENYDALLEKALKKKGVGVMDNRIVCLGYAFDDDEVQAISGSEEQIMKIFESRLKDKASSYTEITIIGFNVKKFDSPIMFLRSCLYNLIETKYLFFYGKGKTEDVMEIASYWQYGSYTSLDKTCKFFGIEGKGDIDGSQVYQMYKDGKHEEIAEYCRQDVEKTRKLYKLLRP